MRILVTGLSTFWGGHIARVLEQIDDVEVIVGVDTHDPGLPLERTEFVRTEETYGILQRIVEAAQIDTIVHTHLIVDSSQASAKKINETNVIGTMNLLAAAGAATSPVRKVIVKSSTLVYGSNDKDPNMFRESAKRSTGPVSPVERSLLEAEAYLKDFATDNPHVFVSLLRFSNVLGDDLSTPLARMLRMRVVPEVFGFDPRLQFTHQDDVLSALLFAATSGRPGIFNVAGDGLLPWSEVCEIVGKRRIALPPSGTETMLRYAQPLGIRIPHETIRLLKYGRGVDNSLFKRAGFRYSYTSAGAVDAYAKGQRLRSTIGATQPVYRYERDVEAFFRHSPAVVRTHQRS